MKHWECISQDNSCIKWEYVTLEGEKYIHKYVMLSKRFNDQNKGYGKIRKRWQERPEEEGWNIIVNNV